MRTQNTPGSFITLIRTFLEKAKEAGNAASDVDTSGGPIYPRPEVVANLLVLRVLSIRMQERLAAEKRLGEKVFRYSSSNPCAPSDDSSNKGR